jgi:hypothetical protein
VEGKFNYSVIIVGAGPAGLFLAARLGASLRETAAVDHASILILEKGPRPGRKLLTSGSGQCNITNAGPIADFLGRYGDKSRFVKKSLFGFTNEDLVSWFESRGLGFETEESGKVFPSSRRAGDILRVLLDECEQCGAIVATGRPVSWIGITDEGFSVGARVEGGGDRVFFARLLGLATGGRSYPGTGSEGDGYALAAALGHRIVSSRPALTPLHIVDFPLAVLAGHSCDARRLVIMRAGKKVGETLGDILITHEGLSGPGILDASRWIHVGDIVEVDWSGVGREEFCERFTSLLTLSPRSLVRTILAESGLPKRMAERFVTLAKLGTQTTAATLKREERESLVRLATAFPARVAALGAWDKAMVTAGGVAVDEINPASMESRLVPGLFFVGELLDIDGDTGGFNLQAAFSTAAAAAKGMAKALEA